MTSEQKETLPQVIARKFVEHMEAFLEEAKSIIQSHSQLPSSVKAEIDLPNIDLHELEHDSAWHSWKKDDKGQCTFAAREGESGWVRIKNGGNTVLILVKALKKQGLTKVSLGLFEYKLSGEDFLQRRALKKPEENDPHARMNRNLQNIRSAGEKLTGRAPVKKIG